MKIKTYIDLDITRKPIQRVKLPKSSTWPYLREIPKHSIHELKAKSMRSSALIYSSSDDIPTHKAAKTGVTYPYYTTTPA